MASAIGAPDRCELNDVDIQRIAANTIDAHMVRIVMRRTHVRLLQVATRLTTGSRARHGTRELSSATFAGARLTTGELGSVALVAVLCTSPAPPPLLTTSGMLVTAPRFARGLQLDPET